MVNKEDNSYHLQYDDGDEEKDMNEGKIWLGLCVLRRTCRQNRLHETLFHTVIILSKHHHHHHVCI
jgi:hypothetical protein